MCIVLLVIFKKYSTKLSMKAFAKSNSKSERFLNTIIIEMEADDNFHWTQNVWCLQIRFKSKYEGYLQSNLLSLYIDAQCILCAQRHVNFCNFEGHLKYEKIALHAKNMEHGPFLLKHHSLCKICNTAYSITFFLIFDLWILSKRRCGVCKTCLFGREPHSIEKSDRFWSKISIIFWTQKSCLELQNSLLDPIWASKYLKLDWD